MAGPLLDRNPIAAFGRDLATESRSPRRALGAVERALRSVGVRVAVIDRLGPGKARAERIETARASG